MLPKLITHEHCLQQSTCSFILTNHIDEGSESKKKILNQTKNNKK